MVDFQLKARGISDEKLIAIMSLIPRHLFISGKKRSESYGDYPLSIGCRQTISQPYMVAVMTELLELKGNERVLEVGTGSGYQAAILAELAAEVFSIERMERLALRARERLRNLGYENVHVITGDGTAGLPEKAPFDRIIITAGTPQIPEPLREQLADNGILVAPVGARFSQQLIRLRKAKGKITEEYHTPCVFVPLVGEYGWKE